MPWDEYYGRKSELEEKLIEMAKEMINEGAELILIGCTAILPALGVGSTQRLSEKLGIPIIDPVGITIKVADMLVSLNLSQSKLAFPG